MVKDSKERAVLRVRALAVIGFVFVLGAVSLGTQVRAQSQLQALEPPPPPPQAFQACTGKQVQTSCDVVVPEGFVAGTGNCQAQKDGTLFCRPDVPPPPPAAAFAACADHKEGESCTMAFPKGLTQELRQGVCGPTPAGQLACRPPA